MTGEAWVAHWEEFLHRKSNGTLGLPGEVVESLCLQLFKESLAVALSGVWSQVGLDLSSVSQPDRFCDPVPRSAPPGWGQAWAALPAPVPRSSAPGLARSDGGPAVPAAETPHGCLQQRRGRGGRAGPAGGAADGAAAGGGRAVSGARGAPGRGRSRSSVTVTPLCFTGFAAPSS